MGWASGAEILSGMAEELQVAFKGMSDAASKTTTVLSALIRLLEECDADTLDECFGISEACDEALRLNGWTIEEYDFELEDDYDFED